MAVFNKMTLRYLPLPYLLVVAQMVTTCVCTLARVQTVQLGPWHDMLRWACSVPPLFAGMLVTSALAMQTNPLGTVVVVRNLSPVLTLVLETTCGMTRAGPLSFASLIAIAAGIVMYEGDIRVSFRSAGMGWLLLNISLAILERLLQRQMLAIAPLKISSSGIVLINNALGSVLALGLAWWVGELARARETAAVASPTAWAFLLASCANGVLISHAGVAAQRLVSASAVLVMSNVNKVAVIAFGVSILGDRCTLRSMFGCSLAIVGAVCFAFAREAETKRYASRAGSANKMGPSGQPAVQLQQQQHGSTTNGPAAQGKAHRE